MKKVTGKYCQVKSKHTVLSIMLMLIFFQGTALFGQDVQIPVQNHHIKIDADSSITDLPWTYYSFEPIVRDTTPVFFRNISKDKFCRYTTSNHLFELNPHVLVAGVSEQNIGNSYFVNGGGATIQYQHKQKLGFWATVKAYQTDGFFGDSARVVNNLLPGIIYSDSRENGFFALDMRARLAFKPGRFFQLEAGIDNHFAGDGYHSVLLGNNGTPHPYGQISTSFWKIDYLVRYHFMKDTDWPNQSMLQNKYMTSHQLNFRLTSKLHFYAWEAVVWKQEDSVTQRHFDFSYLNPVIFFRPVEFQLGSPSPDNVLMGAGFRYQPWKWLRLYGQGLIDEFYLQEITSGSGWWANKYAFQLGLSINYRYNQHAIGFLSEFNMARPFTYSHIGSMQNYGNRNYPLAHPLGANFSEFIVAARWQYKRFGAGFQMALAGIGRNSKEVNYGQNIYRSYTDRESEYGHTWLQGNYTNITAGNVFLNYTLNPEMKLNISVGMRRVADIINKQTAPAYFDEVYLRLSTFLSADMKKFYRNTVAGF